MFRSLISILLLSTCSLSIGAAYNLEDLKALARDGAYAEFLAHAMDVRPSLRLDEWKKMVIDMAGLYTSHLTKQKNVDQQDFQKIETIYAWPVLRQDDVFRARRHELGVKYLTTCLDENPPCWETFRTFWEADKTNPETAYKLAELIDKNKKAPFSKWEFLTYAVKSNLSEFYCKKPFVQKEIWEEIEKIYINLDRRSDFLKKIDELLHPDCLPSLNELARIKMLSPDKTNDRELAFQILKAQFKATTAVEDLFYTIYLLEKPSQGELFNYSWNRVKLLRSLPQRRDAVIEAFKKLDPIPDEILGSLDETKVRAIFNLFKENFPELVDYYFNQCKAYYSGKTTFTNGNPTLHCRKFVESPRGEALLDHSTLNDFKAIFKF